MGKEATELSRIFTPCLRLSRVSRSGGFGIGSKLML
jgi:hypothetical protein